jgi:hypothetical protein
LISPPERLPAFDELPIKPDYPPRSAWGVFGDDDQIGTLNLLTPERVAASARLTTISIHKSLRNGTACGITGIGELFELDALAEACAADRRYEFFFTSAPFNKLGGVASPPNARAIR